MAAKSKKENQADITTGNREPVVADTPDKDFDQRTQGTAPWLDENGRQRTGAEDLGVPAAELTAPEGNPEAERNAEKREESGRDADKSVVEDDDDGESPVEQSTQNAKSDQKKNSKKS